MTARPLAVLGALGFLAACAATTATPVGSADVGEDYAVSGARFSTGTVVDFAIAPRESDGRLVLCGAYTVRDPTAQVIPYVSTALASGSVQIDGETVLSDPTRFVRLDDDARLLGARARCLATGTPWRPAFAGAAPDTRFVRQVFDHDEEGILGGSVVFRERG